MSTIARQGCENAQLPGGIRRAAALCLLLALPAVAQAQARVAAAAAPSATVTVLAETLINDANPELRGEAALVLADTGELRYHPLILEVAKAPEIEARIRGVVALGILSAPGAEVYLRELLDRSRTRPRPDGLAAALALGLLPDGHPGAAVSDYLQRFRQSSYRRQRDILRSLLIGLQQSAHPSVRAALIQLLDDDSNKDGVLRALLLDVLGMLSDGIPNDSLLAILDHGRVEEREAVLKGLARTADRLGPEGLKLVERLCQRDRSPDVRAAALAYLTACRHLPALDLAVRGLRSKHEVEVAQGVRSGVRLGGGAIREAIEELILESGRPSLQAAMIAALPQPHSDDFVEACFQLAVNRRQPPELRREAALVVARRSEERIAPVLRSLFLDAEAPRDMERLAAAILKVEAKAPKLKRLNPAASPEDVERLPDRLRALLHAGHPEAEDYLRSTLKDPAVDATSKARLLRAWRLSRTSILDPETAAGLPPLLLGILQ